MDGQTGPANVKGSALATIAGASEPDATAPPLDKPQSNRGGRRPGAGRKRKPARRERAKPDPAPATAEETDPDEIDAAEAERINNARSINGCVDIAAVAVFGEDMKVTAKEAAQLDAALVEYQRIKGLTRPQPKERLVIIWLKLRGALAAVLRRIRRRA
jgi:hypothetical protein